MLLSIAARLASFHWPPRYWFPWLVRASIRWQYM